MAGMTSFYNRGTDYDNFVNLRYLIDIEIEKFIADKLFFGDVNRIVKASNEMAFRVRARQSDVTGNAGDYKFPFLNYWMTGYEYNNDFGWYNMVLEKRGLYIPEIEKTVRVMPIMLEYEASFWCNRTDEMQYALKELVYVKDNHTAFKMGFKVGDKTIYFIGIFNVGDLEPNAEYKDSDWIERNKISNIAMRFTVLALDPKIEGPIALIEEILFGFAARVAGTDDFDADAAYQIVANKVSGNFDVVPQVSN